MRLLLEQFISLIKPKKIETDKGDNMIKYALIALVFAGGCASNINIKNPFAKDQPTLAKPDNVDDNNTK